MTEFELIINDIIYDDDFQKLKEIKHHQGSRYDHLLKVAKKSYKISKKYNLDYKSCTRGAILHDLFDKYDNLTLLKKINLICNHGKIARKNSEKFNLNDVEKNIIESHMFPLGLVLPKSKEALIVSIIDKTSALEEFLINFKYKRAFKLVSMIFIMGKCI